MLYEISFRGKHNMSKSRLLLILYSAELLWSRKWLGTAALSSLTGLSLSSVQCLVWRLSKWKYINERGYSPNIEYHIGAKGRRFIDNHMPDNVKDELIPVLTSLVTKNSWLIKV